MFDPTELDKVCVQDTHLEEIKKFVRDGKKKNASNNNNSEKNEGKWKDKKKTTSMDQK